MEIAEGGDLLDYIKVAKNKAIFQIKILNFFHF